MITTSNSIWSLVLLLCFSSTHSFNPNSCNTLQVDITSFNPSTTTNSSNSDSNLYQCSNNIDIWSDSYTRNTNGYISGLTFWQSNNNPTAILAYIGNSWILQSSIISNQEILSYEIDSTDSTTTSTDTIHSFITNVSSALWLCQDGYTQVRINLTCSNTLIPSALPSISPSVIPTIPPTDDCNYLNVFIDFLNITQGYYDFKRVDDDNYMINNSNYSNGITNIWEEMENRLQISYNTIEMQWELLDTDDDELLAYVSSNSLEPPYDEDWIVPGEGNVTVEITCINSLFPTSYPSITPSSIPTNTPNTMEPSTLPTITPTSMPTANCSQISIEITYISTEIITNDTAKIVTYYQIIDQQLYNRPIFESTQGYLIKYTPFNAWALVTDSTQYYIISNAYWPPNEQNWTLDDPYAQIELIYDCSNYPFPNPNNTEDSDDDDGDDGGTSNTERLGELFDTIGNINTIWFYATCGLGFIFLIFCCIICVCCVRIRNEKHRAEYKGEYDPNEHEIIKKVSSKLLKLSKDDDNNDPNQQLNDDHIKAVQMANIGSMPSNSVHAPERGSQPGLLQVNQNHGRGASEGVPGDIELASEPIGGTAGRNKNRTTGGLNITPSQTQGAASHDEVVAIQHAIEQNALIQKHNKQMKRQTSTDDEDDEMYNNNNNPIQVGRVNTLGQDDDITVKSDNSSNNNNANNNYHLKHRQSKHVPVASIQVDMMPQLPEDDFENNNNNNNDIDVLQQQRDIQFSTQLQNQPDSKANIAISNVIGSYSKTGTMQEYYDQNNVDTVYKDFSLRSGQSGLGGQLVGSNGGRMYNIGQSYTNPNGSNGMNIGINGSVFSGSSSNLNNNNNHSNRNSIVSGSYNNNNYQQIGSPVGSIISNNGNNYGNYANYNQYQQPNTTKLNQRHSIPSQSATYENNNNSVPTSPINTSNYKFGSNKQSIPQLKSGGLPSISGYDSNNNNNNMDDNNNNDESSSDENEFLEQINENIMSDVDINNDNDTVIVKDSYKTGSGLLNSPGIDMVKSNSMSRESDYNNSNQFSKQNTESDMRVLNDHSDDMLIMPGDKTTHGQVLSMEAASQIDNDDNDNINNFNNNYNGMMNNNNNNNGMPRQYRESLQVSNRPNNAISIVSDVSSVFDVPNENGQFVNNNNGGNDVNNSNDNSNNNNSGNDKKDDLFPEAPPVPKGLF